MRLFSVNTRENGMNPILFPPAMGKIVGETELFGLGMATRLGEGKLISNMLKLCIFNSFS